jgi:hypothetical protein
MPAKKKATPWDKWSFNAAWVISLALALGLVFSQGWAGNSVWSLILVILGVITGFVHTIKDVGPFILVAVALAIFTGSSLTVIPAVGSFLSYLVQFFITYLTPAALIIALRKVYQMFK